MRKEERIVLDEVDKELLKGMIPEQPWEYTHHDFGFMGSPATRQWDEDVKPYKDAGLLEYMVEKRRVYEAAANKISLVGRPMNNEREHGMFTGPFDLMLALRSFFSNVPQEIYSEMGINIDMMMTYLKDMENIVKDLEHRQSSFRSAFKADSSSGNSSGLRGLFAGATGDKSLPGDVIS